MKLSWVTITDITVLYGSATSPQVQVNIGPLDRTANFGMFRGPGGDSGGIVGLRLGIFDGNPVIWWIREQVLE
jgi:hypothetical protein